jgi:tRNA threonylcarbamoyladenosine biosynthesis protein TsaE
VSEAVRPQAPPARQLTRSPEATERLGERLAPELQVGDVLALSGALGAGKTRFVAGLARGLAAAARVRSPSFTLVNEYAGRLRLMQLDLYRVDPAGLPSLGLEELAERGALAVEWGEKLPARWRAESLHLTFEVAAAGERELAAAASAGRGLELLAAWRAIGAEA